MLYVLATIALIAPLVFADTFTLLADKTGTHPGLHTEPIQYTGIEQGIELSFNATHAENVLSLEHTRGLHGVHCSGPLHMDPQAALGAPAASLEQDPVALRLFFGSLDDADMFVSHPEIHASEAVLVGSLYGILSKDCGTHLLLRKLVPNQQLTVTVDNEEVFVELETVHASLEDMFSELSAQAFVPFTVAPEREQKNIDYESEEWESFLNAMDNTTRAKKFSRCSDACRSCIRSGGGTGCLFRCADCTSSCISCISGGGGTGCESRCQRTTCSSSCASCVSNGGGTGCLTDCSGCGLDCTTCISSKGGTACRGLCDGSRPISQCNSGLIQAGVCEVHTATASPTHIRPADITLTNMDFNHTGHRISPSSWPVNVTCQDCMISLRGGLRFGIDLSGLRLNELYITGTGSVSARVQLNFGGNSGFRNSVSHTIRTLRLSPAVFFIGAFPVVITPVVPLKVGASVYSGSSIGITTGMTVSGNVETGIHFTSGRLQPVFLASVTPSVIRPSFSMSGSTTVKGFVSAELTITANGVLSATLPVSPYVELKGSSSGASVFGGVEVEAIGSIGVNLAGVRVGPSLSMSVRSADFRSRIWG